MGQATPGSPPAAAAPQAPDAVLEPALLPASVLRDRPVDPCDPCCALSPCPSASVNTPHVSGSRTRDSCPGETCAGSTLSSKPGPAGLALDPVRASCTGRGACRFCACVRWGSPAHVQPAPPGFRGHAAHSVRAPWSQSQPEQSLAGGFAAAQLHCQDPAGCHSRPLSGASPAQELKSALPSTPHPAAPRNLSMQYPHRKPIL